MYLGPLHISSVTGLARLAGRILSYVHMGNLSLVTVYMGNFSSFTEMNKGRPSMHDADIIPLSPSGSSPLLLHCPSWVFLVFGVLPVSVLMPSFLMMCPINCHCSVKMNGYWPSFFLRFYGPRRSRGASHIIVLRGFSYLICYLRSKLGCC